MNNDIPIVGQPLTLIHKETQSMGVGHCNCTLGTDRPILVMRQGVPTFCPLCQTGFVIVGSAPNGDLLFNIVKQQGTQIPS